MLMPNLVELTRFQNIKSGVLVLYYRPEKNALVFTLAPVLGQISMAQLTKGTHVYNWDLKTNFQISYTEIIKLAQQLQQPQINYTINHPTREGTYSNLSFLGDQSHLTIIYKSNKPTSKISDFKISFASDLSSEFRTMINNFVFTWPIYQFISEFIRSTLIANKALDIYSKDGDANE